MTFAEVGSSDAAASLLGLVAYAKLSACESHAADAAVSPLHVRVAFDAAAAQEEECSAVACRRLTELGRDPAVEMARFSELIDILTRIEPSSQWWERILGTYVGHGIMADLYHELAAHTGRPELFEGLLNGCAGTDCLVSLLDETISGDERLKARLSLWGRRVVGEYITVIQRLLLQTSQFAALIIASQRASAPNGEAGGAGEADRGAGVGCAEGGAEAAVSHLLGMLTGSHTRRMQRIGLMA